MSNAGEIADYHAEAMIERNGDADLILWPEMHGFADNETVVENIVVGQRGPLRQPGSSRRELDIDRVVELQCAGQLHEPLSFVVSAHRVDGIKGHRTGGRRSSDLNDETQVWQLLGTERAGLGPL